MKSKRLVLLVVCGAVVLGGSFFAIDYFLKNKKASNNSQQDTSQQIVENKEMIGKPWNRQPVLAIKDQLASSVEYSTFVKDLADSGLYSKLADDGLYTILIVKNENYSTLKARYPTRFNSNERIADTLTNHILRGQYGIDQFGYNQQISVSDTPNTDAVMLRNINDQTFEVKREPNSKSVVINEVQFELLSDTLMMTGNLLEVNEIVSLE